ncbi:Rha family transcriptional regulator [Bacteroides sp.]
MTELVFQGQNNQALTNSLLVAEKFGKRHADVIRAIENLLKSGSESTNAKLRSSFVLGSYEDSKREERPLYVMNRDGFSVLAMGFTGNKAIDFKVEFTSAFNAMESQLKEQQKPLSQIEILVQSANLLLEQEKRLGQVENKVLEIDARTKARPDYFTIVGYATLKKIKCGLQLASTLGKKATSLCKSKGYQMEEIPDPRFGRVKTYPLSVLEEVFDIPVN